MTALADKISLYRCEDGADFPVGWPTEDAQRYSWRWNEDHYPHPHPPLIAALDHGVHPGGVYAYREADVDPPHMFRVWVIANGFQYVRNTLLAPDEMASFVAKGRALAERHGGPCNVWAQYGIPRAREACEKLRALPPASPVRDAAFLYFYVFHLTHIGGFTVLQPLMVALQQLLAEDFGPEAPLLVQEVGQGGANATIEHDQEIWELGQLAARDQSIRRIVEMAEGGLEEILALPRTSEFRLAWEGYVDRYRWRTHTWGAENRTVGEDPAHVLGLIASAMDAPSPVASTAASLDRREEALRTIEARLSAQPEKLAQARAIAGSLDGYVGVREGRALWQLTAAGSLRHALMKKGAMLAEAGMLGAAEDVFYLLPNEIDAATGGVYSDFGERVEQRKREHAYWSAKRPPVSIGAEADGPLPLPLPIVSEGRVLRGLPASRGTVTAPVRVLTRLDEADSFEPGEVLVCMMTSPPWTPLFAIAAAVVTDSGAPLSHPAIAAREYGIPCVVGAKDASRKLRTGMRVTVDGLAGTVTIEE